MKQMPFGGYSLFQMSGIFQFAVRTQTELEAKMTSVERVAYYSNVSSVLFVFEILKFHLMKLFVFLSLCHIIGFR